jgi:PAS domain S-box-containing protein
MQHGEEFYRRILNIIPTGFAYCRFCEESETEGDFEILDLNQPLASFFEQTSQDLIGKRFIQVKNINLDWLKDIIKHLKKTLTKEEPFQYAAWSNVTNKWFRVESYLESEDYFTLIISETVYTQKTAHLNFQDSYSQNNLSENQISGIVEQNRCLMVELLTDDKAIDQVLFNIAKSIEDEYEGAYCSILLLDMPSQSLKHGAAPSLPEFYNKAFDGLKIDCDGISSGISLFSDKRIIVENLFSNPSWNQFYPLAKKAGLVSCWSEPILSNRGLQGIICVYHRHPHIPFSDEIDLIKFSAELVRLTLERKRSDDLIKEKEERFRNVVENSQAGYFYINHKGYFKFVNNSWLRIHKYDYLNEILGKHYSEVISEIDLDKFTQLFERILNRSSNISGEFMWKCKDGTIGYHTLSANPVIKSGKVTGIEGFIIDITNFREAINSLTISEKKLRESNESKDKFFSIIAHDLKTPFTGLLGFSHLLIEKAENSEYLKVKQYSQIIYDSAHSCHLLLDNLLQWSRAQSGSIQHNPEVFRLNEIVSETIKTASISLLAKKIKLENHIKKDIIVYADPKMISTILRNLLSNAMKFTPREGCVTINYELFDQEVRVSVSDTGVGFSPEKIQKIFNSNITLTTPGTGNEQGTGLGLMICREFISINQGKLWVESIEGKGSTFNFTVPRYPSEYEIDE